MDILNFIELLVEQFDDVNVSELTPETNFKELDDYSSIVALSIIGMIDDEFGITLKGDDLRNSTTINDLFSLIEKK